MTTADNGFDGEAHGFRIIVADDNKANLLVLQKMLKRLGFAPRTAVNGVEAVELADGTVPTLILMDINMPKMDGIEAAMMIRKRHPDAKISIVAVTADPERRHQTEYKLANFDTLIAKPVNIATLQRVISGYDGSAAQV